VTTAVRATTRDAALPVLFTAGGLSAFGTQMTMLALPWLVLQSTGSATRTGLVFAVQLLPMALLGFLGGEVIQRLGARHTMIISDLVRAPVLALIPVLVVADALHFGYLLAIVALVGIFGVPYYASQRILAIELIGTEDRAVTRANSVLEGIANIAAFSGPATAGALITVFGAERIIWVNVATYLVSGVLLALFVPRADPSGPAPSRVRGVWAGLRRLLDDPFLGRTAISTVLFGFVLRVLWIALPLLAFQRFDADARVGGLLVSASGAGALAGSLATYLVSTRVAPARLAVAAVVLLALPLWVLVLPVPLPVLVGAVALSSAAVPLSNAPYFSMLATRVSAEFRPKVLQTVITVSNMAGPLGLLLAGLLTDRLGVRMTLLVVAVIGTCATVNFILALRRSGQSAEGAVPVLAGRNE
jgi:MFS family permease